MASNESPICLKCKKDLKVIKVGVPVLFNYGGGYAQQWDTRGCETCGYEILYGNGQRMYEQGVVGVYRENPKTFHIP